MLQANKKRKLMKRTSNNTWRRRNTQPTIQRNQEKTQATAKANESESKSSGRVFICPSSTGCSRPQRAHKSKQHTYNTIMLRKLSLVALLLGAGVQAHELRRPDEQAIATAFDVVEAGEEVEVRVCDDAGCDLLRSHHISSPALLVVDIF